jgi:xanthine dehydrogenase YagS FAD-binding subunit
VVPVFVRAAYFVERKRSIEVSYPATDQREIEQAFAWLNKYWNKPTQPIYYSPETLEEALSLLEGHEGEAKILAGGTDLLGLMKNKVLSPKVLVNIKDIQGLNSIREESSGIEIGALATISDIESSPLIREKIPLLFEVAQSIGSPQIRNMGTIGGNLCQEVRCWYYRRSPQTGISFTCRRKEEGRGCYAVNGENENHAIFGENDCYAVSPSDGATGLLTLDAEIRTAGRSGGRVIGIRDFYTSLGHRLEPGEIITSLFMPRTRPGTRQRFLKFRVREAIDFATVSVSSVITMTGDKVQHAKIVLGGVSPVPHEAVRAQEMLLGEPLTEGLAEKVAEAAVANAMPLKKNGYKVPLVKALVKRSLLE